MDRLVPTDAYRFGFGASPCAPAACGTLAAGEAEHEKITKKGYIMCAQQTLAGRRWRLAPEPNMFLLELPFLV